MELLPAPFSPYSKMFFLFTLIGKAFLKNLKFSISILFILQLIFLLTFSWLQNP